MIRVRTTEFNPIKRNSRGAIFGHGTLLSVVTKVQFLTGANRVNRGTSLSLTLTLSHREREQACTFRGALSPFAHPEKIVHKGAELSRRKENECEQYRDADCRKDNPVIGNVVDVNPAVAVLADAEHVLKAGFQK